MRLHPENHPSAPIVRMICLIILTNMNLAKVPIRYILASVLGTSMLAIAFLASGQDRPQTDLPRISLQAGMHRIDTQVAATPAQRSIGLMFRDEMPQHEGMLFAFEQASVQCFWMKNTLLPLTAAFVADDGTIVNLVDMAPQTTDSHCSTKPVRYVLEMNQGWFAKKGIKAGAKLSGKPFKASKP
jgi:uncharacterized membrane protein (UPF0127 family)